MRKRIIAKLLAVLSLLSLFAVAVPVLLDRSSHASLLANCSEDISANCLLDTGVQLLNENYPEPIDTRPLSQLAAVGRVDEAENLFMKLALERGETSQAATEIASKSVAVHRLVNAIQGGHDLDAALAQLPQAHASDLWLAGLILMGNDPYGTRPIRPDNPVRQKDAQIAAAMASLIVSWFETGSPKARAWQVAYAAELRARLEDREGVIEVLRIAEGRVRSPNYSRRVFEVAGAETVLELVSSSSLSYPNLLLTAAEAENDDEKARFYLEAAFDHHAERTPWPDFDLMKRVALRSAALGYAGLAQSLSKRMVTLADKTDTPFEAFAHIDAARALHFAGASVDEVVHRLSIAESLFPDDPSEVIANGLVSGPMAWQSSGLAREARLGIASVSASVGDIDRAKRMLTGIDEPVTAWLYLDTQGFSVLVLTALMDHAEETLHPHDYAYIAGQFARRASVKEQPKQHHSWALQRVRKIAETGETEGRYRYLIYNALAVVSFGAGEKELGQTVLERMALSALSERNAVQLVNAGYSYVTYGIDQP